MIAMKLSRPVSAWVALAAAVFLVSGCVDQTRATGSRERVYAADLAGGARKCDAPTPDLKDGQTSQVAMKMTNEGGWCGITVSRSGRPYDSSLLTARPSNGKVLVKRVGDVTRIDYTPNKGFVGTDAFAVKLIPGDATVRVAVTAAAN